MFFYLVCAVLLLNAFTTEAGDSEQCEDLVGDSVCYGPYVQGECESPDFKEFAETYCRKTCGFCEEKN
uniref:ShKT domain-containing protein n=1 Tax=Haemonchus contortus TaxID=6289 RepID=A0A7I5EBM8_HAECO